MAHAHPRLIGLAAAGLAGAAAVVVPIMTSGAQADPEPQAPGSIVENFSYPGADAILAERGITLIKGDGRILYTPPAECGNSADFVRVEQRGSTQLVCFRVLGGTGYLSMEIENAYFVLGDNKNTLSATVLLDGETTPEAPVAVPPNSRVPIGETTGDFIPGALVELRVG